MLVPIPDECGQSRMGSHFVSSPNDVGLLPISFLRRRKFRRWLQTANRRSSCGRSFANFPWFLYNVPVPLILANRPPQRKSKGKNMRTVREKTKRQRYPREYRIWCDMMSRCFNPNVPIFKDYGGRGITVCEEWRGRKFNCEGRKDGFKNFIQYLGHAPSNIYSIERINNDGNYEPGNVRWATNREQARNRRSNRLLTYNGQTLCLIEWAEKTGVPFEVIRDRLSRNWTPEKIFNTPVHIIPRMFTYQGETLCLKDWAHRIGINYNNTFIPRLYRGWTILRALTVPTAKYTKRKVLS